MENTKTELERKVAAIDRKNRAINKMLDKKNLDGAERARQFNEMFMKSLETWGVTEDEYCDASVRQATE